MVTEERTMNYRVIVPRIHDRAIAEVVALRVRRMPGGFPDTYVEEEPQEGHWSKDGHWSTERTPEVDADCERYGCEDRTHPVRYWVAGS